MWKQKNFSYRKLQRKYRKDGTINVLRAAVELPTRLIFGPPILKEFYEHDWFLSINQSELFQISEEIVYLREDPDTDSTTPFATNIGSGYVLPQTGLVLTNEGIPIDESVGPAGDEKNGVIKALIRHTFIDSVGLVKSIMTADADSLRKKSKTLDTICPLSYRYVNYYHWMIETLPRIRYVQEYEKRTGNNVTYIIWSNSPSYVHETLDLLGIPKYKIEEATNQVYHASNVIVPSFPNKSSADYEWIREDILENATPIKNEINIGCNLYISRANAIERRVVNENKVMNMLSKYDFESYRLEELTVDQNVQLFQHADVIVGPHGAGLTDLIYCENNNATVIELFGSKEKPCYEQLASTVGVNYRSIKCEPLSTDVSIDVKNLNQVIEEEI